MVYDPNIWSQPHEIGEVCAKFLPGVDLNTNAVAEAVVQTGAILDDVTTEYLASIAVHHFRLENDEQAKKFSQRLAADNLVEYVCGVPRGAPPFTPNDPGYPGNAGISGAWQDHLTQINAAAAWDKSQGLSSTKIAVCDTHFDIAHNDMTGKFSGGYNYTRAQASPLDTPATCSDTDFHGQAVAGLLGADTDNNLGVCGVSPNCTLIPYQCAINNTDSAPLDYFIYIAAAILAATTAAVKIINLSYVTGPSAFPPMTTALAAAWRAGILLVASAGNDGTGVPQYPAASPNVLAVGVVDGADARVSYSNFGSNVNCAAPQGAVTTYINNGYRTNFGATSGAAPIISGVASLMLKWGLNNHQIFNILSTSAGGDPTTGFSNSTVYRVNADKAVSAALALSRPCFFLAA